MGEFISPDNLNENPKQWLSVPHEMHESLSGLMSKIYDLNWKEKLDKHSVHCFDCEGIPGVPCIANDKRAICNGFIGSSIIDPNSLIHTRSPEPGERDDEFSDLEESYAKRKSLLSSIQTGEPSITDVTDIENPFKIEESEIKDKKKGKRKKYREPGVQS